MKKILVPIDFSTNTDLLLSYAIEIAAKSKANVILAHVFWKTVYSFETPAEIRAKEACIREQSLKKMEELENSFAFAGRRPKMECVVRNGFVANEIVALVKEMNIDLVVMGTKTDRITEEALLKTITTEVMEKTNCPILAVPKGSHYRSIKKIASAINYHDSDLLHTIELTEIAGLFGAEITLFHVSKAAYEPTGGNRLGLLQSKVHGHTYYEKMYTEELEGTDQVHTINDYVDKTQADMLVMASPRRHLFGQAFGRNYAKLMTCHTRVPLLIFRAFDI